MQKKETRRILHKTKRRTEKKIINNDGIFKEMADAVSDKRALAQPNIQKKNEKMDEKSLNGKRGKNPEAHLFDALVLGRDALCSECRELSPSTRFCKSGTMMTPGCPHR